VTVHSRNITVKLIRISAAIPRIISVVSITVQLSSPQSLKVDREFRLISTQTLDRFIGSQTVSEHLATDTETQLIDTGLGYYLDG